MKVLFFYGTRPELIKMGLLMDKMQDTYNNVYRVFTSQHNDLIDDVSALFKPPDEVFDIPNKRDINTLTHMLINKSDSVIRKVKPDLVIIQGDTCTAFACGLSAFHNNVMIGHIEAGLRTYSKNPYPEEVYRRSLGLMASYNWCPTKQAVSNLIKEKVNGKIIMTGNTIVDTVKHFCLQPVTESNVVLVTIHRRENHKKFNYLMNQIVELSNKYCSLKFIFVTHPNHQVDKRYFTDNNVIFSKPIGYVDFINLLSSCRGIITDSGGIQEEALILRKKALICRSETERNEGVSCGICKLVDDKVFDNFSWCIDGQIPDYKNPYGNGCSCEKIIGSINERN